MSGTGVGARVPRKEDRRLLWGKGKFLADIRMPSLRDVAFLRSPLAHARITAVGKPAGKESLIFSGEDMSDVRPIVAESGLPTYRLSKFWALARGKVRFVGEPVAMAIGRSRAAAEDLLEEIDLDLEELLPVASVTAAMAEGAPRLHEEWPDNLFLSLTVDGDMDPVRERAAVVIEREYRTARQVMNPMEGKGVLAYWDERADQLVVYSSTQVPHLIRTGVSEFVGLPQEKVRVIAPDVGGGFGYKALLQQEEIAIAWLAATLRAPFRWVEDRREHLTAGANSREHYYKLKAYADERGRLLGLDAEVTVDIGAYSVWPFTAGLEPAQAAGNLPGPYMFDHYRCTVYAPATNKPPFMPYRGVARPGVCFAIELTMDAIARAVGREPWEVRCENLVPAEAMPYTNVTGKQYDTGDYPESLRRAVKIIDFDAVRARQRQGELDGRRIGVGFSTFTEQTAHGTQVFAAWGTPLVPGYEQATIKLTPDGGIEVRAGIHSFGQGLETTLAQMASEVLTIPVDRIAVMLGDTGITPYSTGAYASRGMVMAGGAVARAAGKLGERIRHVAAHLLQCDADDLQFVDGEIRGPIGNVSFAEIGKAWYLRPDMLPDDVETGGMELTEGYKPKVDSGVFTYATHAAVVAVDPDTGHVEILDYAIVEDCGRVVNPMIVDGQAFGGTAQGIGTGLFEEVPYDAQGQPLVSTLADYHLPGARDIPSMKIDHMESPSPHTEYGIKGIGEGGAIAPAAAVVNAINDALVGLGVELREAPATPERVLTAILDARDRDAAA